MTAGPSTGAAGRALPRTAGEMLALAREFLVRKGIEEARLEAELLVSHALGLDRLGLFLVLDRPVSPEDVDRARDLFVLRGRRVPVAYVIGRREFYSRDFEVGPGVLVPRPETELIVDLARDWDRARRPGQPSGPGHGEDEVPAGEETVAPGHPVGDAPDPPRILDVGTGSGCLAVTLALELDGARVTAVDLSARALEFARRNGERHGVEVRFLEGDGLAPLGPDERFDLVVSNPPYVDPRTAASLAPEVREHEPAEALFSPHGDPDHWARRLCVEAVPRLAPGGRLLVELGHDQGERVLAGVRQAGRTARLHPDLAGFPRVLEVEA